MNILKKVQTIISVINNDPSGNIPHGKFEAIRRQWGMSGEGLSELISATLYAVRYGKRRDK